jgi:Domain of unknown function (DUF4352)
MTDQQTTPGIGASSSKVAPNPAPVPGEAAAVLSPEPNPETNPATRASRKRATPWFRRRRVTLPSAAVLLAGIVVAGTGGMDSRIFSLTGSSPSTAASVVTVLPMTATIGQSVRDGAFAFTVRSVQPPVKTLTGRGGATQSAEGMFVIVRVNVTNFGYEPRSLTATDQFLANDNGQRFATSSAISSLQGAETIFSEKVNPGHTVTNAPLLFDVPRGTNVTSVELHDSLSSKGARVGLP